MKKPNGTTRTLLVALGLAALTAAPDAHATTGTPSYWESQKLRGQISHVTWSVTLATTVIDTTIVAFGQLARPFIGASSVPTISYMVASDLTTAADSVSVGMDVGPTAAGPWTQVVPQAGSVNRLTGTAPWVVKNTVNTTLPNLPFARVRTKNVGAGTITSKNIWLFFPTVTNSVPNK